VGATHEARHPHCRGARGPARPQRAGARPPRREATAVAKRAAYRVTSPTPGKERPSVTKFIAVSNRRGGVGKTTMTMMLAYGLSVGRRPKVPLIDLDAPASTSVILIGHQLSRVAL